MKRKSLLIACLFFTAAAVFAQTPADQAAIEEREKLAVSLANQQLDAYNERNIDKFLMPYSDSVKVYSFPDKLQYKGKTLMRERYEKFFATTPNLKCEITKRIIRGSTIIDEEKITGISANAITGVAIYTIENNKISKVYFVGRR
ncbi:hypothetical protein WSM22_18100 [Cytophagales bacterium WSM2-2]|nr:hypothetical protein WSM22_18100 [Cytophagales bacterium WSM2-2]